MKDLHTIDVVIPVYNGELFIIDAIKSIENQTLKPRKIIIVNDGSIDSTEAVIKNYICAVQVEYIKKENGGPNSARNLGLRHVESSYVAFLDADDVWQTEKLEKQIAIFKNTNFSNLGAVYCAYTLIDEQGFDINNLDIIPIKKSMRGRIFHQLLKENKVTSSASGILIKKECFDIVGNFDEALRMGEDWDMWLRIAEKYDYDYSADALVKIRRHENNTQSNQKYVFENEIIFYNKWTAYLLSKKIVPRMWASFICSRIITRFPKTDFLILANKELTKKAKRRLFRVMFGSLKLYLCATLCFVMLMNCIAMIKSIAAEIIKCLKKIIIVIRKI